MSDGGGYMAIEIVGWIAGETHQDRIDSRFVIERSRVEEHITQIQFSADVLVAAIIIQFEFET